jgi:hypothetical protein
LSIVNDSPSNKFKPLSFSKSLRYESHPTTQRHFQRLVAEKTETARMTVQRMNQFIYVRSKSYLQTNFYTSSFFPCNHRAGANYDFPRHETTRLEKTIILRQKKVAFRKTMASNEQPMNMFKFVKDGDS